MDFLAIVIVIGVVCYFGAGAVTKGDRQFFSNWQMLLQGKSWLDLPFLRLIVFLLVPLLLVCMISGFLEGLFWGIPSLIFMLLILFLAVGRFNYSEATEQYLEDWQRADYQAAWNDFLPLSEYHASGFVDTPKSLHTEARRIMVYAGFQRTFPVIFWFLLLGPWAALGYRLIKWYAQDNQNDGYELQRVQKIIYCLEWPVVQLVILGYGLMGGFTGVLKTWPSTLTDFSGEVPDHLVTNALGALDIEDDQIDNVIDDERLRKFGADEITGMRDLTMRVLIAWLVGIAFWQMFM